MKRLLFSLFTVIVALILLPGCGSGNGHDQPNSGGDKSSVQIKDDTLKGFMLAGVYFVQGYGGADKFESKLKSLINQDKSSSPFLSLLDSAYHKTMVFPFGRSASEKVDSRNTLSNWFQIGNQHDFFFFF